MVHIAITQEAHEAIVLAVRRGRRQAGLGAARVAPENRIARLLPRFIETCAIGRASCPLKTPIIPVAHLRESFALDPERKAVCDSASGRTDRRNGTRRGPGRPPGSGATTSVYDLSLSTSRHKRARQRAIMGLSTEDQMLIEQRVTNDGPSTAVAYLLWFFLFWVSGHRFYLGRPGSAILQILSYFIVIGFLWALIDGFLIPGMSRQKRDELRQNLMVQALARQGTTPA